MVLSLRSKVTRRVLADLFLRQEGSFYVNELARRLSLDSGNLTRKLRELESLGLLKSDSRGRERYYSLNKNYPLINEYRKIILKTVGVEASLRHLLSQVAGVKKAYIYGSYAKDSMNAASDIDLLVVGEHRILDLQKRIAGLQTQLSREINMTSLSIKEYEAKKKSDPFIRSIENNRKIRLL